MNKYEKLISNQEKLIKAWEEKGKIQDEIIKQQGEMIEKMEQLKELQGKVITSVAYKKGYQQALEDIREEHWNT